jgi:PAS domain S-box-containing protein
VTEYAIFMLDTDGLVATWSLGAEKIKGYAASEIIGEHFSKFYPPEDVAAGKPERMLRIAAEQGKVQDEGWRLRKDGQRFWADVVITALRDETGTIRGFGKVTRDLTERRLAEQQLREAEEKFHYLVDAVVDYAIFMLDPEGKVATWNPGAERAEGYTAEEIIGKHFGVFYTPPDRAAGTPERILETVRRAGRFEEEGWRVRKDGTRFWASVVVTALRDARGNLLGFAKVTRDLTARREVEEMERALFKEQIARAAAQEAEKRSKASEEAAHEANRVKDEFLATVSHELRTPLNAILGWASMLRGRGVDPSISKGLEVIHRNAEAQARLIEDILDVSRIITGKLRLLLAPTDLTLLVNDSIEVVRPSAIAKAIGIEFKNREEPAIVLGDPERLRQVIWNLLSNAIKFTGAGGRVTVEISQEGSMITLSVTDTGKGIDPAFLPHVFERFRQADSSMARQFGGLGLGLAIVRHIVELHGGTVTAESAGSGLGATIKVVLPVRAVVQVAQERGSTRPPSRPDRSLLEGLRVLVVDDDPDARELLQDVLLEAKAIVETADSADAGIASLRKFRPHVLVSDIGLPREDGFSFVRRVRALRPEEGGGIPSIALTAYTRAQDRTKALAAGFTTHIGKPVNPDELVAAVANLAAFARR